jgi:hypothetical protein
MFNLLDTVGRSNLRRSKCFGTEMKSAALCTGKGLDISLKSISTLHSSSETSQLSPVPVLTRQNNVEAQSAKSLSLNSVFYEPQSFLLPGFSTLEEKLRKKFTDSSLSTFEGLIALFGALSDVSTSKGFLCVLTLYAKTHGQSSLITQLSTITDSLFAGFLPQSSDEKPEWLKQMSSALSDWKLLTANPCFKKISRVLSLLVTLGVADEMKFCLGGFEFFAVQAESRHVNAFDLIDAIVDTITFFAEGGYQCYTTRSFKPLLFSTSDLVQIEELYIEKLTQWEFARNGNLSKHSDITEAQFDIELGVLIERLHNMYKTIPNGAEKLIVQRKWEALSKIQTEFIAVRISGGLRKAPYCVKIFGATGVGKSTFADITMMAVLKAMNLPCTKEYICTLNEIDKYMSNYRSYVTGIRMDDYGNTKMEFWETSPSEWIIKVCNNIKEYAVMADIANKGKITIEPGCLTITTNVEDMHSGKCSYCPMSILRRAHTHVELLVRPEYSTNGLLDSSKVLAAFGNLDQINDIWLVNLKEPIAATNGSDFNNWVITHKEISVFDYMDLLLKKVRVHNNAQEQIVNSFKEPSDLVFICPKCDKFKHACKCVAEPQFGERLVQSLNTKAAAFTLDLRCKELSFETRVEDLAIESVCKGFKYFMESPFATWVAWVPEPWLDNSLVKLSILWMGKDVIGKSVKSYWRKIMFFASLLTWYVGKYYSGWTAIYIFLAFCLYAALCSAAVVRAKTNAYLKHLEKTRGVLPELFKTVRDNHINYALGAFAGLAALYAIAKVVKALRANITMQGSLTPRTVEDIRARDLKVNPWVSIPESIVESQNPFGSMDHAVQRIQKSSLMQIDIGDQFSGAFALTTNVIIVPLHLLPKETQIVKLLFGTRTIKFVLNPDLASRLPDHDLALIYVPNTGPLKDMTSHFAYDPLKSPVVATITGIDAQRQLFTARTLWQWTTGVTNNAAVFNGAYYQTGGMNTFAGMCMSPIIADNRDKHILGFHIGGIPNTTSGCGVAITHSELTVALVALYKKSQTHMRAPQASEIQDVVCGKDIVISPNLHPKCPSNFITGECDIEVYGTVTGRATSISAVCQTPISPLVEEIFGIPNKWGPPQFAPEGTIADGTVVKQHWKPWFASLEVCSKPSIGFDPAQVDHAMEDYLTELKTCFDEQASLWKEDIKPLTDLQVVSGIDGKRFIDSMPTGTSIGYPIGGPKSKYMVDLEPTDDCMCPREFLPIVNGWVDDLLLKCDKNESLNQIFGANLKDEPTPLIKEKVRVFQAAPVALQFVIRKYFLPVARFLSINPLISECAVGINAQGPEWDELSNFMAKFGEDRVIAGDYAKYDLRMPEQLTISAFRVLITIAEWSGNYTVSDLKRMRVIAFDVCTPLVAYNGTLMRFFGTNPSGQNMTVYVNSVVNSLLHRLAFSDAYDDEELCKIGKDLKLGRPARFRDLVSLSTYGDDAKGSVKVGYDKFNHVQMTAFLGRNDMVFTMPDKESDPVPFMSRYRADFLKRKDRFEPLLNMHVGMLDENSIYKSLHSVVRSKAVSVSAVCAMNVEGALREWFFHGEEVYEKRRSQLQELALRADLPCRGLEKDFSACVDEWKQKYVVSA